MLGLPVFIVFVFLQRFVCDCPRMEREREIVVLSCDVYGAR